MSQFLETVPDDEGTIVYEDPAADTDIPIDDTSADPGE